MVRDYWDKMQAFWHFYNPSQTLTSTTVGHLITRKKMYEHHSMSLSSWVQINKVHYKVSVSSGQQVPVRFVTFYCSLETPVLCCVSLQCTCYHFEEHLFTCVVISPCDSAAGLFMCTLQRVCHKVERRRFLNLQCICAFACVFQCTEVSGPPYSSRKPDSEGGREEYRTINLLAPQG